MFYPLVFPRDTHLAQVAAGPEPPSLFYLGDTHLPYARWRPRQITLEGPTLGRALTSARCSWAQSRILRPPSFDCSHALPRASARVLIVF